MDKPYADYTPEDFLNDPDFQSWVRSPSPNSDRFWSEFQRTHPDRREALAQARVLAQYFQRPEPVSTLLTEQDWRRLQRATGGTPVRRIGWLPWMAAASVALTVLVGGWLWLAPFSKTTMETGFGQTRVVTLPDGSVVTLNANSRLDLRTESREVWLSGEAFFKVKKTANRQRFVVHTDRLDVVVLGTSFNVRDRREKTDVVLQEGQVRLERARQPAVVMKPGDRVELDARNQVSRRLVNPENYRAWMQNRLVFEGTPVREVLQTVEDLYGVSIDATGDFTSQKLTAVLPSGKPEYVLNALAGVYNLTVEYDGERIRVREKRP